MAGTIGNLVEWVQGSWLAVVLSALENAGVVDVTHAVLGLTYFAVAITLLVLVIRGQNRQGGLAMLLLASVFLVGAAAHWMVLLAASIAPGFSVSLGSLTSLVGMAGAIMLLRFLPEALTLPRASRLVREVDVRRAAEFRARISEAQLTDLFHHLPDSLFVVRLQPDGTFIFENVNAAFRRLVAEPDSDLIGLHASAFLPHAAAAGLDRQFAETLGVGHVTELESPTQTREGHRIWHSVFVPLRAEGADVRLLGSIRDVTTSRRLRSDLQEASRLATVGSMCAGVAHEMSQPINIVSLWIGRARGVIKRPVIDQRRLTRSLDIVDEQTKRLSLLLERMRDLTNETNDQQEIIDAGAAALGAVEVVGRQFALRGVSVLLAPRREAMPVRGQRAQLEQALLQVVANAADAVVRRRQANPDAPGQVRVSLHADNEAGDAVIEVRDTGGGVPEGLQHRIFDPFFTTKDPGQGTGLGLAIAQGTARAMGGSLTTFNVAQGTPEAGAIFRFSLPLVSSRSAQLRKTA